MGLLPLLVKDPVLFAVLAALLLYSGDSIPILLLAATVSVKIYILSPEFQT